MDIQVSSNVERLLFELYDRNGMAVAEAMTSFRDTGRLDVGASRLDVVSETFNGSSVDDEATLAEIARTKAETGVVVDPHTAVGLAAARAARRDPDVPMIALATAHPAKFADAVERATGDRPALPAHLADLLDRPERYETVPADLDRLKAWLRVTVPRQSR
jgi:threonine synthase